MTNEKSKQIDLLQENLESLRRLMGWTAEELGEKIGVTKQTISNLERRKTQLSKTQYIALRTVLDYESNKKGANQEVNNIISLLLDMDIEDEKRKEMQKAVKTIALAASAGLAIGALIPFL